MTNNKVAETKLLTINSADGVRLNGDNLSNIRFNFNDIVNSNTQATNTISLLSAEIPFSIYNVNETNNIIKLQTETSGGVQTNYTMTLTEGNYNGNTFITEFKGRFNTLTSKTCNLTLSNTTGVYSLEPADTTLNYIKLFISGTTANNIIGLKADKQFNSGLPTPTALDFPCNFLGVKKLSIYSDALAGNNINSNSLGETTLIDTISVNVPAFGLIIYQSGFTQESVLKNNEIGTIDLQIRDDNFNLVDFNNITWEMTFLLKTYSEYKETMKVGTFASLIKDERRDETIKKIIKDEYGKYEDTPIKNKLIRLQEKFNNDLSEYDDPELEILMDE